MIIRGTVDDIADPLVEQMARTLINGGEATRTKIYKEAVPRRLEELGKKRLNAAQKDALRKEVDDAWFKRQGDIASVRVTGGWADDVVDPLEEGAYWLDELVAKADNVSPIREHYNNIDNLVIEKQYDTLATDYPWFVSSSEKGVKVASGGVNITTPFFRSKAGGISLGMRSNRQLTAPARNVMKTLWEKMPYDGMRSTLEGWYKRRGVEVGERLARREIGAWEVDGALQLARAAVKQMNIAEAPDQLRSSLIKLTKMADDQGMDAAESYTALARMLDEGFDEEKLRRLFTKTPSDDMVKAMKVAHEETRVTLDAIHTALKKINPNMGDMENYFPLLASTDFQNLLKRMGEGGVDEAVADAMQRALLEGADDLTQDQRLGLQILSQFSAKYREEVRLHKTLGAARGDQTVHMNARVVGKSLFSPLGGVEMGLMNKELLRDLAGEGAEVGWASRVELNRVVKEALSYLENTGAFKGRLKTFEPFSMDLPDVLNSYVRSTSRVIHFNALVDEATRLGIVSDLDEALDIGQTIAEALRGPLSREAVQLRIATRKWLRGDAGQPSMTTLDVVEGWQVKLPKEMIDHPQVAPAFKKLRSQAERAQTQSANHLANMEEEVRKLVDVGVDEAVARDLAPGVSDPVLQETQAALYGALADEAAAMRASMQDLAARVPVEKRVDVLKLADALTEQWMQVTRQTIRDLRKQWTDMFGYERYTSDSVVDLLARTPEGAVPLAEFVEPMERALDDLLHARAVEQLPEHQRHEILRAATTGDMKLSLVRALDEIASDQIMPQATQKAWKAVRDTVITSDLTVQDLIAEVGHRRAVEIMQSLSGFKPPASTVDDLAEVAERFASKRGASYVPREADRLGDQVAIMREYQDLPEVQILDEVNGVVAHQWLKFRNESVEQIEHLRQRGYQFIPYDGPGAPYKSLREQVTDIVENRRLLIPLGTNKLDPLPFKETYGGMPMGNLIDGLHVVMGHAMHDFDGTFQGITSAWLAHGQMYSDDVRGIFTTLTRGRRTAALRTRRPQPRKIGVMDAAITDVNLDDWATNTQFGVLAQKEDFAEALRLAEGMDKLPSEIKSIEGNHAISFSLLPPAEGPTAIEDFYARVVTADGRQITFKRQQEFEQWQQAVKTEKLKAASKVERVAAQAEGRVVAAQPIPSPPKTKFRGTPEDLEEAIAADIQALRSYRSEVKAWQARVYEITGPSGKLDKKTWRQVNEWIKEQYNRAQKLPPGPGATADDLKALKRYTKDVPLVPTTRPDARARKLGLPTGKQEFQRIAKGKLVTPEEYYGLVPPTPPEMTVLTRADVDSFPMENEQWIGLWAERFDDPDRWLREAHPDLKEREFLKDTVYELGAEDIEGFSVPLPPEQQTPMKSVLEPEPKLKTGIVIRKETPKGSGRLQVGGKPYSGNINAALRQLREEAEGAAILRKRADEPRVSFGRRTGETPEPAAVQIDKAAGESEILAGVGPISNVGDAAREFERHNQLLRDRYRTAMKSLNEAYAKFTEVLKDFNVQAMFEQMDDGLLREGFEHHSFRSGVMEDLATAGNRKLRPGENARQVSKQHIQAIQDEAKELADSRGLKGLTDGRYLHPSTNVFEEIKRALVAAQHDPAGAAQVLARYEDDVRELLEMIGLDGERILFEPLEDGTFRLQYLTGEFEKADHTIPPEMLREELEDWIPYPTAGLSTQKLTELASRLVDDGMLSLDVVHPSIARFFERVPGGVLPVEVADYEYLRTILPQLWDVRQQFKAAIPKAARNQKAKAADYLNDLLEEIKPFLQRRKGDVEKLDELWDKSRNTLEKVLTEEDFVRVQALVEQAPVVRTATAKSRMGASGSVGRRWRPVNEAFEAFDRARKEVANELFVSGIDVKQGQEIIAGIDMLEDSLLDLGARRARPTASAGALEEPLPPGYRQLTRDAGVIEDVKGELERAREIAPEVGRQITRLSTDTDYQNYVKRELAGILPEDADIEKWIKDRAQELNNPMRPITTPVTTRAKKVEASVVGIAGEKLDGKLVDESFALLLENMASHIQAAFTPIGMKLMSDQLRGIERYWKAAVTVARPTFVPRNLLGGMFNNTAIDVGMREYAWVSSKARQVRRAMQKGMTFEDAIDETLSLADADVFRAASQQRVFDAEFTSDIAQPLLGTSKRSWNPAAGLRPGSDRTFVAFDVGGTFMQSSEDFLRMAAFKRWYDPLSPESANFAAQLTFAVHFDYSSLTKLEAQIKKFVPFYVWTRRNIPLQAQLMMERPGFWNRYANIQREAETSFEDREYSFTDRQPVPNWMGRQAADLDTVVDRGEGLWLRMFLDPDLPTRDLEQLVDRFSGGNPFSNAVGFATDMLTPLAGVPFALAEEGAFEGKKVTAPTGLAEVIKGLNAVGLYWGEEKGGEPVISRTTRQLWETAFPFLREWTEIAGIAPNDPARAMDLGYRLDDGVSAEERALGAFMGLGKAVGIRGTTPHDTLAPALDAQRKLEAIEDRARGDMRLLPGSLQSQIPREGTAAPWGATNYHHVDDLAALTGQAPETGNVVVDGDTLKLNLPDGTRETVRLLGVNTPEAGELGAQAAGDFIERLLASGGTVRLVRDIVDEDVYGRKLRYVWVGDRMLNLELIEQGFANPQPYYPNRAFEKLLDG